MKKTIGLFLLFTTFILSSCSFELSIGNSNSSNTTISNTTPTPNTTGNISIDPPIKGTTNNTNPPVTTTPLGDGNNNYYKYNDTKYTLRDTNQMVGWSTLNSTGTQKVLVVPVHFTNGPEWTSTKLNNLEKIFFGESKDTNWQSVKTYFDKSSYGNLNITGEVYDKVIEVGMTATSYDSKYYDYYYNNKGTTSYDPGDYIGNLFYKSVTDSSFLKDYDQDKDGYIDAVIFCYSNSYSMTNESVYWAWVSGASNNANSEKPTVNIHMWVSYEFINDEYQSYSAPTGLDGHTFIHEMGHIIGLDDYYCYDESNSWDSAGALDMQAYNIGDHNIYSKLSLGWVDPYVVTGNADIKLRSSALYGDAILINNSWNKTIYDEYILIEYYTPEGMNEQDSKYKFDTRDYMYQKSGLRIYHVDARLVKIGYNDSWYNDNSGYIEDNKIDSSLNAKDGSAAYIGASNSVSLSHLTSSQNPSKVRLLHLIDKGGKNTLSAGTNSSKRSSNLVEPSSALWQQGDVFEATSSYFYKGNNKFNDGSEVGYTVTVGATSNGEITVSIRVK